MGADTFEEEAFAEISEDDRKTILANERVTKALRSKRTSVGTIEVGEDVVSFRLSINKKLRRKLSYYKSKIGDTTPDIEEVEKILYDILSSLCTEEPWNSWATWSVYDDSADNEGAQEILMMVLQRVNAHMEDVKNFR